MGFGLGALGVLLGLTLCDVERWWWRLRPRRSPTAAELTRRIAWGRACRAGGRVLAIGGASVSLMTLLALLARLDDRSGAVLVMTTLAVATTATLAWAAVYAHRYHPRPVRSRGFREVLARAGTVEPQPEPTAIEVATASTGVAADDPLGFSAPGAAAAPVAATADLEPAPSATTAGPEPVMPSPVATNGSAPAAAVESAVVAEASAVELPIASEATDETEAGPEDVLDPASPPADADDGGKPAAALSPAGKAR